MKRFLSVLAALILLITPQASSMIVVRGVTFTPVSTTPTESANDSTIVAPSFAGVIIDASDNGETFVSWTVVGGVVKRNGVNAQFTSQVITLLYHGGVIYQENSAHNWWSWNGTDWVSEAGGDPRGAIPVINSNLTATGTVGVAFTYTITATNSPTTFSATPLPSGLSVNTGTGAITGTPTTTAGSPVSVTIDCSNATGSAVDQTLVITINASQPQPTNFVAAHFMAKIGIANGNARALSDYKNTLIQLYEAGVDVAILYWDDFAQPSADFWQSGVHYNVGDFVRHQYGNNYTDFECIQATNGTQEPSATVNVYTSFWVPSNLCYKQALIASEELVAASTPAAKIGWGFLGLQDTVGVDTEALDFVLRNRLSTGLFRDSQNRFIISGYNNTWNSTHTNYLNTHGGSGTYAYWPDQAFSGNIAADAAAAGATGWFQFLAGSGVISEAGSANTQSWETLTTTGKSQAAAVNIGYMPAVYAEYIGNQNASVINGRMYAGGSLADLIAQINFCRTSGVPAYQVVTANDFQESSYIQNFGNNESVSGPDSAPNWTNSIIISHAGFRPVMKHYATWYKTGTEPTISQDVAVICYPLCPGDWADYSSLNSSEKNALDVWLPSNAVPYYTGTPDPRAYATLRFDHIETHDAYDDRIELWVACAATRHVTLSCGSSTTGAVTQTQGVHLMTILGATTVSTPYGTRNRFTSAQWDNKPHVKIQNSTDTITYLDADAPQFIRDQRHPVPGGANRLCVQMLP